MMNINFMESKLVGFSVSNSRKEVSVTVKLIGAKMLKITMYGVEKFVMNEVREQNIIEEIYLWPENSDRQLLKEAAFWLFGNSSEENCIETVRPSVQKAVDRVINGDLMLMDAKAIYGAEFLAAFSAVDINEISGDNSS